MRKGRQHRKARDKARSGSYRALWSVAETSVFILRWVASEASEQRSDMV